MARDLLRRWWGLELGLAEGDGSGYERTSHATCATLVQLPGGACAEALRAAAAVAATARDASGPRAIVHRCHAGLAIVAAAVRGAGDAAIGVVYASGARHGIEVGEVERAIAAATKAGGEAAT